MSFGLFERKGAHHTNLFYTRMYYTPSYINVSTSICEKKRGGMMHWRGCACLAYLLLTYNTEKENINSLQNKNANHKKTPLRDYYYNTSFFSHWFFPFLTDCSFYFISRCRPLWNFHIYTLRWSFVGRECQTYLYALFFHSKKNSKRIIL